MTSASPGSVNRASGWRPEDDHYNTPRFASIPFVRAVLLPDLIWEPACGEGAISRVLEEHGHTVISTTLVDRGYGRVGQNFLECCELLAPAIVTNPPFGIIDDFIEHALTLNPDVLAVFARTKFVEGAERFKAIHSRRPFSVMYQFIERIKFFAGDTPESEQPGWNTEAFAWFVYVKGWRREPVVRWLRRDDGLQGDMFAKRRAALTDTRRTAGTIWKDK